jgi:3-oxoacyl-[acyl-carrier-protein] synthase III
MAFVSIGGAGITAIVTCTPERRFDNLSDASAFSKDEVRKVVGMAGVSTRRLADESTCSSDLCIAATRLLLHELCWGADSLDALIMVTQTPDYLLPSTACVIHNRLGLSDHCAAFDVGLGCSGFPYGLWLAAMMVQNSGFKRVLLLHGETPSRFSDQSDRSVSLLFGDAGSATAICRDPENSQSWFFEHHTDGTGFKDMIIEAGGFRNRFSNDLRDYCVRMNGANIFNFTIKRVPPLIEETLLAAGMGAEEVDYFIFHQSNQFIIKHLANKLKLPIDKVPMTLKHFGNTGGASIPLTITQGNLDRPADRPLRLLLVGYGVGLSWSSGLITLGSDAKLMHVELKE